MTTGTTTDQATYTSRLSGDIAHVVIVYPYTYVNPYNALPPIGAEYLQAGVVKAGRTTTLLDMRFEDDISDHLARADLVCLYGFFEDCALFGKWEIHVIDETLAAIPEHVPVVAGGTGFGEDEETLERYPRLDAIIKGMPNIPILELLEQGTPEGVTNLTYRTVGDSGQGRAQSSIRNARKTHPLSEDVFPIRALRNPLYRYECMGQPIDLIRAAQGCNYHCRFCYQYGKDTDGNYLRWQGRSAESQFNELKTIDARLLLWVDDDMTTNMEELDKLSGLLIENKIRKVMVGTGRVDHVVKSSVATLKKMERAGFLALAFGVESLSNDTLRFYRKGQTVELATQAMGMLKQTNIMLVCNFLLGSPGESEEDMMEYLWFGGRFGVDHLVTNRLRVPEGSYLHSLIYDKETGEFNEGMERIRGPRLKRIKHRIKFGQGTPFRLFSTFLKLMRHRGMYVDPLYFICCAAESMTQSTWVEKTRILKVLLWPLKMLALFPPYRWLTRAIAYLLTPLARAAQWLWEKVDRPLGISTRILPAIFGFLNRNILRKQKVRAQLVPGRQIG